MGIIGGKPHTQPKLPPEDERYNRRLGGRMSGGGGHGGRSSNYKRLV